jgi:putative nucleotidyltransferase with HDIG domain
MSDVVRYLTSLAQALAKMSLYAEGHPARGRAADTSFELLRALQRADAHPTFSFLGGEVVYGTRPVRDLEEWGWARKLSTAGIQRLEFGPSVDREEYRAFLNDVLGRLASSRSPDSPEARPRVVSGAAPIRFGALGVRGGGAGGGDLFPPAGAGDVDDRDGCDLSEEAETAQWVHAEVAADRDLPLAETETLVYALATAMHAGHRALLPLLTLKEFDQYTTTHALNVAVLSMALAEQLGLSSREVRMYGMTGLLHDLGKVKVPLEVLRKPGALNSEELELMRRHPVDGARLILEHDERLDLCAVVAFEHHIMIDGGGYPVRQQRCDCHHASMLVHVCDVFDALRTNRPYRAAWETPAILEYLSQRIGREFEPTVTSAFLEMMSRYELQSARASLIDGEVALPAS